MISLKEFRKQYPIYDDIPDSELADDLHKKFYSDVPRSQFFEELGVERKGLKEVGRDVSDVASNILPALAGFLEKAPERAVQTAERPGRIPGNILGTLGKGITDTASLPADIRDYLVKRGLVSQESPSLRPPEELLPRERDPYALFGAPGNEPGDELIRGLVPFVAGGVPGKGIATSIGKNVIAPVGKAAVNNLIAPVGKVALKNVISPVARTAGKAASSIVNSPKNIYSNFSKIRQASNQAEKLSSESREIANQIMNKSQGIPERQIKLAERINKEIRKHKGIQKTHSENISPQLAVREAKKKQNLIGSLKKAFYEDISPTSRKNYAEFGKSSAGQKKILNPISIESFEKSFNIPKSKESSTLDNIIKNTIGYSENNPIHKDPFTEQVSGGKKYNQANPSVEDYILLLKHTRDDARHLRENAAAHGVSQGDKERLIRKAKSLEKLHDEVDSKIKSTLSKEENSIYSDIQDYYKNKYIPFKSKSTLRKAVSSSPEITVKKFHESLNKHNVPQLKEYLLENHREVKKAIENHDLMGLDITNPKKINSYLYSDAGTDLTSGVRNDLKALSESLESEKSLRSILGKVQSSEIAKHVDSVEMQQALKDHPEISSPYSDLHQEQARIRKLENVLKQNGMSEKQIRHEIEEYYKAVNVGLRPFAWLLGWKGRAALDASFKLRESLMGIKKLGEKHD